MRGVHRSTLPSLPAQRTAVSSHVSFSCRSLTSGARRNPICRANRRELLAIGPLAFLPVRGCDGGGSYATGADKLLGSAYVAGRTHSMRRSTRRYLEIHACAQEPGCACVEFCRTTAHALALVALHVQVRRTRVALHCINQLQPQRQGCAASGKSAAGQSVVHRIRQDRQAFRLHRIGQVTGRRRRHGYRRKSTFKSCSARARSAKDGFEG